MPITIFLTVTHMLKFKLVQSYPQGNLGSLKLIRTRTSRLRSLFPAFILACSYSHSLACFLINKYIAF